MAKHVRALERAYLRVLLDPSFRERLTGADFARGEGLEPHEVELLSGLPAAALHVERQGRRAHLWARARGELPRTLRRAEARLPRALHQRLIDHVFCERLWHPERTTDLPVVGRGFELGTHVRDALEALLGGDAEPELEVLAALASLERARLIAALMPAGSASVAAACVHSAYDLREAAARPDVPAPDLACTTERAWEINPDGEIYPGELSRSPHPRETRMPSQTSLVLSPGVQVELRSYRLNNFINASLHYLSMGRLGHDVGKVYAAMCKASRAGTDHWFESSGAGRYFRREANELFLADDIYFGSTVDLFDPDLGVVFVNGRSSTSLSVPVDEQMLSFFGKLLPRLRATVTMEAALAACSDEERGFVHQLREAGFLEQTRARERAARTEFNVRLIGHAALALETPSARVLFDPLFVLRDRKEVAVLHELDDGVDAVVISHPHWDHCNIDTLLQVPRETLMIVPALTHQPSIENVDIAALLRQLGFSRVKPLLPWQSVEIGEARVTATPFYGEQSGPEAPQDWMTYHVSAGGRAFVGAVDACHNSDHSMDRVMQRIQQQLGHVDVLFAPYSGFHYPIAMFTRRPFYMGPGMEQYSGNPDDAVRWCSLLGADYLVPYAGFVWQERDYMRREDQTHRGSLRRLRSIVKSHPRGPLLVLEPGGRGLRWRSGSTGLDVPESLSMAGVSA